MRTVLILTAVAVLGTACTGSSDGEEDGVQVVASLAPLAEVAEAVGGDAVDVTLLATGGVEPHDLELKPSQVDAIQDADLVLYVSGGFQPAVERAVDEADGEVVDIRDFATQQEGADIHVWLDPSVMTAFSARVAAALGTANPDRATIFTSRALELADRFAGVHKQYATTLVNCKGSIIVTSHASFGSVVGTFREEALTRSPDAEASPARLDELARLIRAEGITTVFSEPGAEDRSIETLARESGAKVATLDPIELESEEGEDYFTRMRANLLALVDALGCA